MMSCLNPPALTSGIHISRASLNITRKLKSTRSYERDRKQSAHGCGEVPLKSTRSYERDLLIAVDPRGGVVLKSTRSYERDLQYR